MGKKDFEIFLLNNSDSNEIELKIDWGKEKQDWLNFINIFYDQVKYWLEDYNSKGLVKYSYTNKNITEENIGSYEVKKLDLKLAGSRVTFDPIGTLLIGAKGRIDLVGPKETINFVLVDKTSRGLKFSFTTNVITGNDPLGSAPKKEKTKEIEWAWKILNRHSPQISYDEFTEDNFLQALMESING
ncbi:hypothetical protein J0904_02220 [Acinetobacter bereziniae]|uniref:hypothetical protein n=1 Tax=Acinetobacter bereziniae TaxID=106648 RepID=UPI00207577D4|nr:hypothetical protein [Acinetobacter bereziniae]MCM8510904.1 hypothetical protein [Acinetobacter bereziniae]